MPEKIEDAEMTCNNCGSDLVCHMSKYEGGFENKLQWQNSDGSAHYKWKSAGKFDCVLPKEGNKTPENQEPNSKTDKMQTNMQSEQELSQGESQPEVISLATLDDKIKTIHGMCEAILHMVTDLKLNNPKTDTKVPDASDESYCSCRKFIPNSVTDGLTCQTCLKLMRTEK